jgi:hypothetical protein
LLIILLWNKNIIQIFDKRSMNKLIYLIILTLITTASTSATTFTGEVTKVDQAQSNRIINAQTKQGVEFAKISIPQKKFRTYTDANGNFELPKIWISEPTVFKVEKEGYRPFSLTINNAQSLNSPLQIEIAQSEPFDIVLDSEILHLGDNSFSKNSANAGDFKLHSIGPYYSKEFTIKSDATHSTNYIVIGSIIGLDTELAKTMGQNKIKTAYSSPAQVYFNGKLIGEIKVNGDGQRIKIPKSLIIANSTNQVTIKTGQNMMPSDHIDYDDIEIMNLSILCE